MTMNLNSYDSMTPIFRTWIVPENKKLYSSVIPYHRFYTFLKRYDNTTKSYNYYIAFSNKETSDRVWYRVYLTKTKAIKIDLSPIWDNSKFKNINTPQELSFNVDDKFDDGVVYHIDI